MDQAIMNDDELLRGSLRALLLIDIAEEIDLALLRNLLGTGPSKREPAFRHPAPEYVRFEQRPVVEDLSPWQTNAGEEVSDPNSLFQLRSGKRGASKEARHIVGWSGSIR